MNTIFKYNANAKYSTKDLKVLITATIFHCLMYNWMRKETLVKFSYQASLKIIILWQNQGLQQLVMNGHSLFPFGENLIIAMVNTSLN